MRNPNLAKYKKSGDKLATVVYPICCGLDVHKVIIVATMAISHADGSVDYTMKTFTSYNSDLEKLHEWLLENNCKNVCMESTGKYWYPVYNVLEDDIEICLAHPKYTRAIKGKKNDKKDSKWIADLHRLDLVKNSFIPQRDIRELRDIARYRNKLTCMRTSEKNRIQNCMTMSNIALANIVSDPFGVTAQNIVSYLMSHTMETFDEEECRKLIRGKAKANADKIIDSVKGYEIASDQLFKLTLARGHNNLIEELIEKTEEEIQSRVLPYMEHVNNIAAMPGMSPLSASLVIAEIGVDMTIFESANSFASWAGLVPADNESANKKKSVRISRAGQYLKPVLVQCALGAVQSKKNPYFAYKYQNLKRRRGHKKAIIAVARMMLISIYYMMLNKAPFNPSDYDELINRNEKVEKKSSPVELSEELILAFLIENGYDVSTLGKVNKE
jgi:transposase